MFNYEETILPQYIIHYFKAVFQNNNFIFNNELGQGEITFNAVANGLYVSMLDLKLPPHQIPQFQFVNKTHCSLIIALPECDFDYLDIFDIKNNTLDSHTCCEVYFSKSNWAIKAKNSQPVVIKLLLITFSIEWLNSFLNKTKLKRNDFFCHILTTKNCALEHGKMDHSMMILVEYIAALNWDKPFVQLLAYAKIIEVFHALLNSTSGQKNNDNKTINKDDYEKMQKVRSLLVENWQAPCPSIKEMSMLVYMSESKFKKLFKALFQKPYYTFFLHIKLARCMDLLKSGNHSVTEVAYIAGYNRASKFTEIFKRVYVMNPSAIIKKKASHQ